MPFESFMAGALFDPGHGYYTRHIAAVGGHRGDFATSASLTGWLGQAIAAWALEEAREAGRSLRDSRGRLHLIEVGPGSGALAATVWRSLPWWPRRRWRHHLVEVSPVLREHQRQVAPQAGWHGSVAEALDACEGRAILYSNELFDAFPVVWLRWRSHPAPGQWEEVHVAYHPERGLEEVFVPLAESRPGWEPSALVRGPVQAPWAEGQRVEVHAAWEPWFAAWRPKVKRASMLAIDYGGAGHELYARRPEGTLRAFFRHQRLTGPAIYRLFGRQDLTADVDFTRLRELGEEAGWRTQSLQSQSDFLRRWAPGAVPLTRESAFIAAPHGAGEAFQALSQRWG